jgi:carboxyl-terminal processing protease
VLVGCAATTRPAEIGSGNPVGCPVRATRVPAFLPAWAKDIPPVPYAARERILSIGRLAMTSISAPTWSDLIGSSADRLNASAGVTSSCRTAEPQTAYLGLSAAVQTAFEKRVGVTENDLVETAAWGIVSVLGDEANYWTRADLKRLPPGSFEPTFGLLIGPGKPFPTVKGVERGSVAYLAGVQAGEQIVALNGKSLKDANAWAVARTLAGFIDEDVHLELTRSEDTRRSIVLNRASLAARGAVRCRIIDASILLLRLERITASTPAQMREAARSAGEIGRRLILDLRGSPGGLLESSLKVADLFITSGELAQIQERSHRRPVPARPGDPFEEGPVVTLIDGSTTGAAEVIAGAIQDHRRGPVLGTRTPGKTEVKTTWILDGGDALALVTERVLRSDGTAIFDRGVSPDASSETMLAKQSSFKDVACPGTADIGSLQGDPLVHRALELLRAQ